MRRLRQKYELKMEVLGPKAGQTEEVRVLNRIIRWTRTGLGYEPDQRHAERIISELELETCKCGHVACRKACQRQER